MSKSVRDFMRSRMHNPDVQMAQKYMRRCTVLETCLAELLVAGRAVVADYTALDAEGDFRHDPQLHAEWDAAVQASGARLALDADA